MHAGVLISLSAFLCLAVWWLGRLIRPGLLSLKGFSHDQEAAHRAKQELLALHQQVAELSLLRTQWREAQEELKERRHAQLTLSQRVTELETLCKGHEIRAQERLIERQQAKEQMRLTFEELASRLLEQKGKHLQQAQHKELGHLLAPFQDHLARFAQQVKESHQAAQAQHIDLRLSLQRMQDLNLQIGQDAANLTQALKGDQKRQGQWGEFILERLLERSGLAKGREYVVQESFRQEGGQHLRPDVIIKLPEGKQIIVDAKTSLVSYEKWFHAQAPEEQNNWLKAHMKSVKQHIARLSTKQYAAAYPGYAFDFVLMFIPLEPAFALAIKEAPELVEEAYKQHVFLVGPSTLMSTLGIIAHIWKREHQNQHTLAIAKEGGGLYDKLVGFVEGLQQLSLELGKNQQKCEGLLHKLAHGRGNVLRRAEKMKQLGAHAKKSLPETALASSLVEQAAEPSLISSPHRMLSDDEHEPISPSASSPPCS